MPDTPELPPQAPIEEPGPPASPPDPQNNNPYLTRTKPPGSAAERNIAQILKAKRTPASGALAGAKSDMVMREENWRIEVKSTTLDTMSLKLNWLRQIQQEANDAGQQPALAITFVTGNGMARDHGAWVAIPMWLWQQLIVEANENRQQDAIR